MEEYTPSTLEIITGLNKAIDIYPSTQFTRGYASNRFLIKFDVEFRIPERHKARFLKKGFVPSGAWFSLFVESEKEIMEDESNFYGILYRTTVAQAIERLEKIREKMVASHRSNASKNTYRENQEFHNRLEEIWDAYEGFQMFNEKDEIIMTFLFPEWPSTEVAKKTNYVKQMQSKILGLKQKHPLPF